jgi:3-hydroxyacyl-[acyl-carrier-protein] dehydratase
MPHRFPFLFIDEAQVLSDSVQAVYKIKGDENFLKGHFKDNPSFSSFYYD